MRIIGGRWRGRRLSFLPIQGLRPTPDRVRETVFNWLVPWIPGSRCLDLFAGSGALGIEALSRGAAEVVFVERHPDVVRRLGENLVLLGVDAPRIEQTDALTWLGGRAQPFDVVLLDPPFGQGLLVPVCTALERNGWLASEARIYVEAERELDALELPKTWEILREKTAGQVVYRLAARRHQ